ncbi:general substrate transporter [Hyaloscypha hepaticicola]|uniref:General substrate transporter n=1 Tax=Hyaloscypha hepaticicola TaxID=2082293 RepID=A0A2J6PHA6_9HELO|nr:general substrate transporter [Hyaloscypha hepaticicola]
MASTIINWSEIQPHLKWQVLAKQKRFLAWALYSSIGSMMLGFDFGIAGTCTAFPAFQQKFGIPFPSQPSGYLIPAHIQSGWSGASSAGSIVGEIIVSIFLLDKIGRKHTIAVGGVITAIGIAMQVAAHEWKLFLAGRLINAIGFGVVFLESPVWIGENCRPELRGFFLCIMNGSIVLGQFLLSCISKGTSEIEGKWSYEILIILQFAFVAALLVVYPFYPESPYYLIKKGRPEQARKALDKIHGRDDLALLEAEMARLTEVVQFSEAIQEAAATKGSLLRQCFQGSNLKRTLIAALPAAGQQLIGAAFVLGYVTYFLSLIGVKQYFTVSVVLYVIMLVSNISAFVGIEWIGRRALLVPGIIALTLILLVMGIMGCLHSSGALWVIIVCIFLWAIAYQLTIGAVGFAIGAEVSSPPLRSKVQGVVGITQGVFGWLVGFVSPYMINPDAGDLGAKVGFVFAGLGVPLCILFYFLMPETRGLSFEEIDYLFANKTSCRRFQDTIKVHRATYGDVLEIPGEVSGKHFDDKAAIGVEQVEDNSV